MTSSSAPAALLDPRLRIGDVASLGRWGQRVGLKARDALHIAGSLAQLIERSGVEMDAVLRYYRADHPSHSFHAEPHEWLRLIEVQATKGLAHFLRLGGAARTLAFLRALDPSVCWPAALSNVRVPSQPLRSTRC